MTSIMCCCKSAPLKESRREDEVIVVPPSPDKETEPAPTRNETPDMSEHQEAVLQQLDSILDSAEIIFFDCLEDDISSEVKEICKEMLMTDEKLQVVMCRLLEQMMLGLDASTKEQASTKCWNTYVQDLPTGEEQGSYLALDLGGTNFRVLLIKLDREKFDMKSKIYPIPANIMTGTGEQLFDHIAECLAKFTKEQKVNKTRLSLGFTFSFPVEQIGLTKGILQRWTKGFNASGVVGEDVVEFLNRAIAKRDDVAIDVMAILNDTTGTLMSCAWKNRNTRMGVILGTGSNACYVEAIENIPGFDGNKCKPEVLINIEWGAFGDHGELDFITTCFDRQVDEHSINPGKQIYEKMISGMYLGELVRVILVKLTGENVLFNGKLSKELDTVDSFKTSFLSDIEGEKSGTFSKCKKILKGLKMANSDEDCANVRYICEVVSKRAASLAGAGVATVLNKMDHKCVTVGIDGSLYRFHPYFNQVMEEKIKALAHPHIKFQLMLSEDGSGRGAALVAAAASDGR